MCGTQLTCKIPHKGFLLSLDPYHNLTVVVTFGGLLAIVFHYACCYYMNYFIPSTTLCGRCYYLWSFFFPSHK